ncbi:MAG: SDR family NAD(P)-dependent oxidoreductase [Planctomycetota bacterium]
MHLPTNDDTNSESGSIDDSNLRPSTAPAAVASSEEASALQRRLAKLTPAQRQLFLKKRAERRSGSPPEFTPSVVSASTGRTEASVSDDPIAIVGMGCRFPGAKDLQAYWQLIENGSEAVAPVPENRWEASRFYDPTGRTPGKMAVNALGSIAEIDQFDPAFFGIAPREASRMDPQQRLLLEVTWEAFERAGIPLDQQAGSNTGVFIGIGGNDYAKVPVHYPDYYEQVDAHIGTGNALSIAAARISYLFDFQGPAFIVDTACSSALVAIHSAVVSLHRGECDMAVAGGVNVILTPETTIAFSKAQMLSSDGHCRPFDSGANGYVRGEGCGVVLLKRLSEAKRDGDQVLGVLAGTAVNQDGRTSGITAPNSEAQQRVIRQAMKVAKVSPDSISYVEAHGTGTPLGDPIELHALNAVFSDRASGLPPVRIGSVKANIGHTETASGIAGLLKVLLMFRHQCIPAQANFESLNGHVQLDARRLRVAQESMDWSDGQERIAGVSSFGFGGTNAHLIVRSLSGPQSQRSHDPPKTTADRDSKKASAIPFVFSAHDGPALADVALRMSDWLSDSDEATKFAIKRICHSAAATKAALSHRAAVLVDPTVMGDDKSVLSADLASFAKQTIHETQGRVPAGRRTRVAMLFTGQGSQYAGMSAELYEANQAYRHALDRCDEILTPLLGQSLHRLLADQEQIHRTAMTQPAICAVQCALVDALGSVGIRPSVVCGHSIGEIAALYAGGAFDLTQALSVAAYRGQVMGHLPTGGAMAAILADETDVRAWLKQHADRRAVIAAYNGPGNVVVSGDDDAVQRVVRAANDHDAMTKPLNVSHAFHSPRMQAAVEPLRRHLQTLFDEVQVDRSITFISSLTGQVQTGPIDVDYWLDHLVQPVRFTDALEELNNQRIDLAIEVGPMPQLIKMLRRITSASDSVGENQTTETQFVAPLDRTVEDDRGWATTVAQAWCVGVDVNWSNYFHSERADRIELPTYPFQRDRYWFDPPGIGAGVATGNTHPLLGTKQELAGGDVVFSIVLRENSPGYVADHVVSGSVTFPAAGWLEMVRAAVSGSWGDEPFEILDFEIHRATFLEKDSAVSLQLRLQRLSAGRVRVEVDSRSEGDDESWNRCVTALAQTATPETNTPERDPDAQVSSDAKTYAQTRDTGPLYQSLANAGLQYGSLFQTLHAYTVEPHRAIGDLRMAAALRDEPGRYAWHPTLLDGAFQLTAALLQGSDSDASSATYLPVGVQRVRIESTVGTPSQVEVRNLAWLSASGDELPSAEASDLASIRVDVTLMDSDRHSLATFQGLKLKKLIPSQRVDPNPNRWIYETTWDVIDVAPVGGEASDTTSQPQPEPGSLWYWNDQQSAPQEASHWVFQAPDSADHSGVDAQRVLAHCDQFRRFIQAAIRNDALARVSVLTRSGLDTDKRAGNVDTAATAVVAMARVAANEHPQLQLRILDLDRDEHVDVSEVASWLARPAEESELALRDQQFLAPRMVPAPGRMPGRVTVDEISLPAAGDYRIRLDNTDRIEGLWAERIAVDPPKSREVSITIDAIGLNFSDVLKSIGLYPGVTDAVVPLGVEVCGRIDALGPNVERLSVGQRVMGIVPHGFATKVLTSDYLLCPVPEGISDDEAASLPVVFLTAHHALRSIGRLSRGETVLIHAAAGGVGMAAIQVAHSVGATVFATAGSSVKRRLLTVLGVPEENVFDSRDVASLNGIKARTNGRGVDVVLNSLPGEWIDRSLELLAAHGRFLEIGKTDIYQDRRIGLRPFQDNLSYSAIDLDRLFRERPQEIRQLFAEVAQQFAIGSYRPAPLTTYRLGELPAAMRYMAARRNIGKIVVSPPNRPADALEQTGTYLITGGSGMIARGVAARLIRRGAKSIVLLARRARDASMQELVDWANQSGATCDYVQADLSDKSSVQKAVDTLERSGRRIVGIVHAAGVLEDGLIHELSHASLRKVLQPKVDALINLDAATADHPVHSIALLGSIAAPLGSPGQANYAAANAFMEGYAARRSTPDRRISVVHWGPWEASGRRGSVAGTGDLDAGGMAAGATPSSHLAARGLTPLEFEPAADLLIDALLDPQPGLIVMDTDLGKMLGRVSTTDLPSRLRLLKPGAAETASTSRSVVDSEFLTAIVDADEAKAEPMMISYLTEQLAVIMALSRDAIDPDQPLSSLGLDSLMAIELKNGIEAKLDLTLPISKFMDQPTIRTLALAAWQQIAQAAR